MLLTLNFIQGMGAAGPNLGHSAWRCPEHRCLDIIVQESVHTSLPVSAVWANIGEFGSDVKMMTKRLYRRIRNCQTEGFGAFHLRRRLLIKIFSDQNVCANSSVFAPPMLCFNIPLCRCAARPDNRSRFLCHASRPATNPDCGVRLHPDPACERPA